MNARSGKSLPVADWMNETRKAHFTGDSFPSFGQTRRIGTYENHASLSPEQPVAGALPPPQGGTDGSGPGVECVHADPQRCSDGPCAVAGAQRVATDDQKALLPA